MSRKIVCLTEGHSEPHAGKTAANVIRYRREEVVAMLDSTQVGKNSRDLLAVTTGEPAPVIARLADAPGANTLLLGIAPPGGKIPASWRKIILEAIDRKMDILSGLHDGDAQRQRVATAGGDERLPAEIDDAQDQEINGQRTRGDAEV